MQTNPDRGTLQQTSEGPEAVSKMSASRFMLPTVYPVGRLRSEDTIRRPMITHTIDQFMLDPRS